MKLSIKEIALRKAERAVIRAAVGCINPKGYAYTVATEEIARTFFINERAFQRLESAIDRLKKARRYAR